MRFTRKGLSSPILLMMIAVIMFVFSSAPAKADTPAPGNTGTFVQTEPVKAKIGDLTVVAPASDWRFGRLRGRIEVIESATAVGRTTYKVEATARNLDDDVIELRDRKMKLRAGQTARVGYGLRVSEFGREVELEVAVYRADGDQWVPVGSTSLTLRWRVRVRDTLTIGSPVVPPPSGFSGLVLENRTTGASASSNRFNKIDFRPAGSSTWYRVNFVPSQGEAVGTTTEVDPGEDAKIASADLAAAGFGAGTYEAVVLWSNGAMSTITWNWSGSGRATATVNDQTPRAMP